MVSTHEGGVARELRVRPGMSRYGPPMDCKARAQRRMVAVRRRRAGESAAVIAADLGVSTNSVYEWGKKARRRRVGQFFRRYDRDINGEVCARFVRALLRKVRGPATLIWDGLGVHRSPPVRAVLARSRRVEVCRLPAYAPELNPVEAMWSNGKEVKLRGMAPADAIDLEVDTELALDEIGPDQPPLRSFFAATPLRVSGVAT